jgi:hypothetical protein
LAGFNSADPLGVSFVRPTIPSPFPGRILVPNPKCNDKEVFPHFQNTKILQSCGWSRPGLLIKSSLSALPAVAQLFTTMSKPSQQVAFRCGIPAVIAIAYLAVLLAPWVLRYCVLSSRTIRQSRDNSEAATLETARVFIWYLFPLVFSISLRR